MRLLVAAWFGLSVNYVPIHRVTKTHLDNLVGAVSPTQTAFAGPDEDHHDGHQPHASVQHNIKRTFKSAKAFPTRNFVPVATVIFVPALAPLRPALVFECMRPPDALTFDTSHPPRAPPRA